MQISTASFVNYKQVSRCGVSRKLPHSHNTHWDTAQSTNNNRTDLYSLRALTLLGVKWLSKELVRESERQRGEGEGGA